jgi:hypothetical protein
MVIGKIALSLVAAQLAASAVPEVAVTTPKLSGGTVASLEEALDKTRDPVAQCVAQHGGLDGDTARIDVQFLVRDRGRAEGVEIVRAQRVREEATRCVQKLLKNRWIGMPSEDPVGVSFSYKLKRK